MKIQTCPLQLIALLVGCSQACRVVGPIADCVSRKLRSVPALPPNITHLYLEMNRIGEIDRTSLSGLEELQVLDLGRQFSRLVIRNDSFLRQTRLKKLVLGFNVDLRLEPRAFVGLSALQKLHLDYCSLQGSILEDSYLEPLTSLETLDLFGNRIRRLKPAMFFSNLTHLRELNLKLNRINRTCETDLAGFRGKHFTLLNLDSNMLGSGSGGAGDCGNPFRGISFQTLDLSNNGFLTADFFRAIQGTKIHQIHLSGPMGRGSSSKFFQDPDRLTFQGLGNSSVRVFDLSKNFISALQDGVFSPLREVRTIDMSRNKVQQIHRNAFEGVGAHLRTLILSFNSLCEIQSHTFASLEHLQELDLSHNNIGMLGYNSFMGLHHLKELHLTGNSLSSLGGAVSLPSLNVLMLNDNKVSSLYRVPEVAPNVTQLSLQNNQLTNLGEVSELLRRLPLLQTLLSGGNPVSWCSTATSESENGSNNLRELDLHDCNLQSIWSGGHCLDLFHNLSNLVTLNLRSNRLKDLPQSVFKGLTSLTKMDLSSNALTYLQPDVLPGQLRVLLLSDNFIAAPDPEAFTSVWVLDLERNRFHCSPALQNFLAWLNNTNVTLLTPAEELRCEFPPALHSVPLTDYSPAAQGARLRRSEGDSRPL
ncbi:toll-like receptor 5 [Neosynchiropus ocellatus]